LRPETVNLTKKNTKYHVVRVADVARDGSSPGRKTVCDGIITYAYNVTLDADQEFDEVDASFHDNTEEDYQELVVNAEVAINATVENFLIRTRSGCLESNKERRLPWATHYNLTLILV
jgi:hypothetical protein